MPSRKQKVKIFRRKYGKHPKTGKHALLESLEEVINNFLKENLDHRIILVQYNARSDELESETAFIVFEVTESSTGSGGGGGHSKPESGGKPRGRPKKTEWDRDAFNREANLGRVREASMGRMKAERAWKPLAKEPWVNEHD